MAKSKPRGNPSRDWILRIVIFGGLAVVLVLAYRDYQVKQQATKTGQNWRALLEQANEDEYGHLPAEKLKASLQGSPAVTETDLQNVYTWKGSFRSYAITVNYDRGNDKPVSDIEGP